MKNKPKIIFDVLSLFPESFETYPKLSILGRATESGLIKVAAHQLRDWSEGPHNRVDDKPYGGGPGMIMQIKPFDLALKDLKAKRGLKTSRIILMSAKGKPFTAEDAVRLSKYRRLVFLCGRYEGVDERVAEHLIDEEISIGPYVLTGGELPALVMIDAIARQIPGVLGAAESLDQESHTDADTLEAPQYTRPEKYRGWRVPLELLSGSHATIAAWRKANENHRK